MIHEDRGFETLDSLSDDIVIENGPCAGPWRRVSGKDAFIEMALAFPAAFFKGIAAFFKGIWRQDGRCVYAYDHVSITLVHETGTLPNGDAFDNRAIWISRLNDEVQSDRIWTVDLDSEACETFWERNPAQFRSVRLGIAASPSARCGSPCLSCSVSLGFPARGATAEIAQWKGSGC